MNSGAPANSSISSSGATSRSATNRPPSASFGWSFNPSSPCSSSLFFSAASQDFLLTASPDPVFYFAALVPWSYFSYALQSTTNVVVDHLRLITKVYFPRLILPISTALSGLVDFAIGFIVLSIFALANGILPTFAALWLPVFLLLALFTALGVGLWMSALNALYQDVRYVIPFLIQFWMFASPVAYPSSLVPPRWRWLYGFNPMAGVIDGFRWAVTSRGQAPGLLLLGSASMVMVVLVGGLFFFNRMEGAVADRV